MTVVDVHAHAMPWEVLTWLSDRGLADLTEVDRAIVRIDPVVSGVGRGAPLPLAASMYRPEVRLREMVDAGVTHEVVTVPPFLLASASTDIELVSQLVSTGNDSLVAYCAHDPEHLLPFGAVPLGVPGVEVEARRCLDDLGMRGIALGSRGGGRELDDPVNEPLWELLHQRQVPAFLHPSGVPDAGRIADFWLPQLLGYPMETAIAVARLVFGGVIERRPFPLVLAHGGGCLPGLRGRLTMGWERKPVAHTTEAPPTALLQRLYYDTAVFEPVLLSRLVEDVGSDHVVLGTDHPFDLAERDPLGFVARAGLAGDALADVLSATAVRLLGPLS